MGQLTLDLLSVTRKHCLGIEILAHETVAFKILRGVRKESSKFCNLLIDLELISLDYKCLNLSVLWILHVKKKGPREETWSRYSRWPKETVTQNAFSDPFFPSLPGRHWTDFTMNQQ